MATLVAAHTPGTAATAVIHPSNPLTLLACAASAAENVSTGSLLVDRLRAHLNASVGGVLPSRTWGLTDPRPNLIQRVKGLFGHRYVVLTTPRPHLIDVDGARADFPAGGTFILAGNAGSDIAKAFVGLLPATDFPVLPVAADVPSAHGVSGLEFTILGTPAPLPTTWLRCPTCQGQLFGYWCPLCHVRASHQEHAA